MTTLSTDNAQAVLETEHPFSPPRPSNEQEVLFSARCREGDKHDPTYVNRKARPMLLDSEEVVKLWFRLNKFPILFATPQESNFNNFVRMLQDEYSILLKFDDVGMAMITDIVPGIEARFHISFWDSRLSGREQLIRELIKWMFSTLRVRRVAAPVRADARAMRAFLERTGLYFEGALKNWVEREDNKYFDLHLYGITKPEVDTHWMSGRSWAKPRVRLLKSYETS